MRRLFERLRKLLLRAVRYFLPRERRLLEKIAGNRRLGFMSLEAREMLSAEYWGGPAGASWQGDYWYDNSALSPDAVSPHTWVDGNDAYFTGASGSTSAVLTGTVEPTAIFFKDANTSSISLSVTGTGTIQFESNTTISVDQNVTAEIDAPEYPLIPSR